MRVYNQLKVYINNMKETLKFQQKKITIKKKLLLINMLVAVLSVVAFGILITKIYNNSVTEQTKVTVNDSSLVITDRVTRVLKDAENCSNYLTVNINKLIEEQGSGLKTSLATKKAITNELYVAKIVFDEIDSIAFVSQDGEIYVSDYSLLINKESILNSTQLSSLHKTTGKSIWFPSETRNFLVRDTDNPVLTMGKKVIRIESGNTLGYLFLNVNITVIESNLQNQLINYWVIDDKKAIISSAIQSVEFNDFFQNNALGEIKENSIEKHFSKKYYVSSYPIGEYGWRLIGITDIDEFNVGANNILNLLIIISVLLIVFEMLLSNYLTKIITSPLLKLKNGAEEIAGGNLDLRFRFKSEDEIGQLGKSFNYMTSKVQDLLIKVDYEGKKKREYELSLLHQQVKPHFLYNSLDIVLKLSEMNKNREARRVVKKLADYYRNSLSDSKEIITVKQEIKIVEDYLELQRISYQDLFVYEIDIEDSLLSISIPKLTLQPIVENSIYHGLKYKDEKGLIRIEGEYKENYIIIKVKDNGIGMSEERSNQVLHSGPEGHFGLYSVNHRIKLLFGVEYGIRIFSKEGEGTVIEVLLPRNRDNKYL